MPAEKEQINQAAAERAQSGQLVLSPRIHSQSRVLLGSIKSSQAVGVRLWLVKEEAVQGDGWEGLLIMAG